MRTLALYGLYAFPECEEIIGREDIIHPTDADFQALVDHATKEHITRILEPHLAAQVVVTYGKDGDDVHIYFNVPDALADFILNQNADFEWCELTGAAD
jgi:hypothetical protein